MDIPNAFIGKAQKPTVQEVSAVLGPSAKLWDELVDGLAKDHGVSIQEWNSFSLKYGWSLRLKLKKRTIIHLSPCNGCFRAAFILGDRAVKATRAAKLPKNVIKVIEAAPKYAEGTGVRLTVKAPKDLAAIRKLAVVKLMN
jgi:hypothetical protein